MAPSQSQSQARMQLSAEEMRDISLEISRDFAPRRFRAGVGRIATPVFSPQELLGISQQISREFAPRADAVRPGSLLAKPLNTVRPESVEGLALSGADKLSPNAEPVRLGTGLIVALPVDPLHLHVYWQLDEQASTPSIPADSVDYASPLTLRVFCQAEPVAADTRNSAPTWFDVPVDGESSQQQIVLPASHEGTAGGYQVAIGRLDERQQFTALAYSNTAVTAPQPIAVSERLSPAMAQFIILPSQASSTLAANACRQQNHST